LCSEGKSIIIHNRFPDCTVLVSWNTQSF
jgi:hypothetical protein